MYFKKSFKIQPERFLNLFLIFGEKFSLVSHKLVSYKKKTCTKETQEIIILSTVSCVLIACSGCVIGKHTHIYVTCYATNNERQDLVSFFFRTTSFVTSIWIASFTNFFMDLNIHSCVPLRLYRCQVTVHHSASNSFSVMYLLERFVLGFRVSEKVDITRCDQAQKSSVNLTSFCDRHAGKTVAFLYRLMICKHINKKQRTNEQKSAIK